MDFTIDQQKAIDIRDSEVLLSAAAGSGKTAVLIERVFRLITDKNINIDLDNLLIVTFTDAAAKEMKSRLLKRLQNEIEENEDENLQKQIKLVASANISTIHSFCTKVIRNNFQKVGLDPMFKIGDSNEIALLKQESVVELFEKYYEENNPTFNNLIELFCSKVNDENFTKHILNIYRFTRSNPYPEKWLDDVIDFYNEEDNTYVDIIKEDIASNIDDLLVSFENNLKVCQGDNPKGPAKYAETLSTDIDRIKEFKLAFEKDFESAMDVYNGYQEEKAFFVRIPSYTKKMAIDTYTYEDIDGKEVKKSTIEIVKNTRDADKKEFASILSKMNLDITLEKEIYCSLKEEVQLLINMVKEFTEIFDNKKREKNLVDYNDLEHFAIKILLDENNEIVKPSDVAIEYQNKFYEVLTDEYQDTNAIQEAILGAVAKKENGYDRRFVVGDIKQSIYGFRKSDPEIFNKKRREFNDNNRVRIDLSKNFRSSETVIDGINFIFNMIMQEGFGGIDYTDKHGLVLGNEDYIKEKNIPVEILIGDEQSGSSDDDMDKVSFEGKIVANKIRKLIDNHTQVAFYNEEGSLDYRDATYKDITVLFRSSPAMKFFKEEFQKHNIPVFTVTNDFFDSYEITLALSLLQIVDNTKQDIHLLTVLRSSLFGFTVDELATISALGKGSNFADKLYFFYYGKDEENFYYKDEVELIDKITSFIELVRQWQEISKQEEPSQLLWKIYSSTNIIEHMNVNIDGNIKVGNLKVLLEKAVSFEKSSYSGLFNFLKYIERIKESEENIESFTGMDENDNVVKFMTIHKSKGLEFPIVILAQSGKEFNTMDTKSPIVMDDAYGFSMDKLYSEERIKHKTLSRQAIALKIEERLIQEEIRILYVALTRAKERLIISGAIADFEKYLSKHIKEVTVGLIKKSKSYFDMMIPALVKHRDFKDILSEYDMKSEIVEHNSRFEPTVYKKFLMVDSDEEAEVIEVDTVEEHINEKIAKEYIYIEETKISAVTNVTEIKRRFKEEQVNNLSSQFILRPKKPSFMQEKEKTGFTPAEIGTIYHTIFENLDVKKCNTKDDIYNLFDELTDKGIITKEEKEVLEVDRFYNFVNSDLGKRIKKSSGVYKEVDFVLGVDNEKLYGIETESKSLVSGIIDCYFIEDDHIVLLDYKTDKYRANSTEDMEQIKTNYKVQLEIYKEALEKNTGMIVKDIYLYLTTHGDELKVELD